MDQTSILSNGISEIGQMFLNKLDAEIEVLNYTFEPSDFHDNTIELRINDHLLRVYTTYVNDAFFKSSLDVDELMLHFKTLIQDRLNVLSARDNPDDKLKLFIPPFIDYILKHLTKVLVYTQSLGKYYDSIPVLMVKNPYEWKPLTEDDLIDGPPERYKKWRTFDKVYGKGRYLNLQLPHSPQMFGYIEEGEGKAGVLNIISDDQVVWVNKKSTGLQVLAGAILGIKKNDYADIEFDDNQEINYPTGKMYGHINSFQMFYKALGGCFGYEITNIEENYKTRNVQNIGRAAQELIPSLEGICLRNNCTSFEEMIEITQTFLIKYLTYGDKAEARFNKEKDSIIKITDEIIRLLSQNVFAKLKSPEVDGLACPQLDRYNDHNPRKGKGRLHNA